MSEFKKPKFFCKPPEPWYHEPVKCHKVPEEFWDEAELRAYWSSCIKEE